MKTKMRLVGIAVFALASLPVLAATEDLILSDGLDVVYVNQDGTINAGKSSGTYTGSGTGSGGDITFVGTIGQFSFDIDSGQALPGTTLPTLMNTSTVNTLSTGKGTLTITFSQTGYTSFASTLTESGSDTYDANTPDGSTVTLSGYDNGTGTTGTLNSTSNPIGTVLSSTDTSNPLSQSDSNTQSYANTAGSSGSLTEVITLAYAGAGTIDTGFTISNVATPEPTSIVLLGSILLALAGLFRKKLARRA